MSNRSPSYKPALDRELLDEEIRREVDREDIRDTKRRRRGVAGRRSRARNFTERERGPQYMKGYPEQGREVVRERRAVRADEERRIALCLGREDDSVPLPERNPEVDYFVRYVLMGLAIEGSED